MFKIAESVRNEFVLRITGKVRRRPEGATNANITSGEIEILCEEIEVLNAALTPPFQLDDENLSETVRLTNRVIDLRRPQMQKNMMLRYKVAMAFRRFLDSRGFIDIETPMLTKSTPEGARDYLVPSRVHPGEFFALPQSPQLFKQLLMWRVSTVITRSPNVSATRTCAPTASRNSPSGYRDFIPERDADHRADGRDDPQHFQGNDGCGIAQSVPAHELCGSDGALRFGQAGLARDAGADRSHRCGEGCRVQGVRRCGQF